MISQKDWRKMRIKQKALELAFADLDQYDQRMYLSEAEKAINKSDRAMYGSELNQMLDDEQDEK